jgi:hypothetical protein
MSLEIKINDSFVPFEFAPNSVKIDLEWALMNNAEMVVVSTTPVKVNTCKVCEYAHEGLYCENCFTGERVNVSAQGKFNKWAKVIRIHDITKKVGN